jgi:hypothetical protein
MRDDFRLGAIFAELAPTRQKWLRAMRVATITALGAAVMATMQIVNPLGLTMLVNLSLPEASFPLTRGTIFLFCAAVFQFMALTVAASLAESPAIELAAFIVLSLASSYLIYSVPALGRLWLWIQVPLVTAFYMVLFVPAELGWDNAQMLAGMAIAVAILLLFNNLLWPVPASLVLAGSLAEAIERSRSRFRRLVAIAVGDAQLEEDHPVASQLGRHVALIGQIHEISNAGEFAELLAWVMGAERIHSSIDNFASTVLTSPGAFSESNAVAELRILASIIDSRFELLTSGLRQQLFAQGGRADRSPSIVTSPDANTQLKRILRDYPHLAQLGANVTPLATLLEDNQFEFPKDEVAIAGDGGSSLHGADRFLVRFATRHTLALTIAFLLGLWDNNAALHAAIWLLMLGGPPSHGATVRKFTMRAFGSTGALALAALGTIIVAPNYTSLPPYMAAIFVGVLLMAYIGEGGGILSYLAIGGTAFVIGYSGPGPRSDVLGSIWSIWGISVGMIIRAALTLLWREHPHRTLAEEFQAPFAAILELIGGAGDASKAPRRSAARRRVLRSIQVMLGVANDALLEGQTAGIEPNNLIEALDTMLRLTFMLDRPDLVAIAREPAPSPLVMNAVSSRFEGWLEKLQAETEMGVVRPAPLRRMVREVVVPPIDSIAEPDESRSISTRAEADHVIVNLTLLFEQQLSVISRGQ